MGTISGRSCTRSIVTLSDPHVKFIDITGDGLADVLIIDDDVAVWHESLGKEGWSGEQGMAKTRT